MKSWNTEVCAVLIEGRGHVPPQPVVRECSHHQMLCLWDAARERADAKRYRNKSTAWERGILDEVVIEGLGKVTRDVRPILAGMMGEWATADYINDVYPNAATVNLELIQYGDYGVDLQPFGLKLDCKTRQREHGENLIQRVNEKGREEQLRANAFVFCEWLGYPRVRLLGFIWTKDVHQRGYPLVDGRGGQWKNNVIPPEHLESMQQLREWVGVKRGTLEVGACR